MGQMLSKMGGHTWEGLDLLRVYTWVKIPNTQLAAFPVSIISRYSVRMDGLIDLMAFKTY